MYRLCSCIEFLYQPASKLLLTAIVISITHSNSNRERKRWKAGRKEEGGNRERGAERGGRDRKERK